MKVVKIKWDTDGDKELLKTFGFNFKIERLRLKLSQEDVAFKTGFSISYISNIENAKHNISLCNAVTLAKIVNKNIDEMLIVK